MKKLLIYLTLITIGCHMLQVQNIELSNIDGTNGLTISAIEGTIAVGNVRHAGDVNSDGFNDVLIWTDYNLYLIFGTSGPSEIDLSNFTLAQGFIISNANELAFSGTGDVNGDKIDDLIIANANISAVCVIFGSKLGFQNIDINECSNGTFGIQISGCPANYTRCSLGTAVSGAGDINGDNLQDMLIAADLAGPDDRSGSGVVFVIWGYWALSNIDLTNFNSSQAFSILGPEVGSYLGDTISKVGDMNGDGIDDFILGTATSGFPAYVIYGSQLGFSNIDLATFNSSQGFAISVGNQQVKALSHAGDVNGDNLSDVVIGLFNGTNGLAYVLYGSNMMPFNVNLTSIVPAQGFLILTNQTSTFGQSVSGLGDFNQDGLDDIVISAYDDYNNTGAAYVVFGTKLYPTSINVDTFPSTQGIVILGAESNEEIGYCVSGVGDFNGDNVPDIALSTNSDIASGYVVYSPYKPAPLSAERLGFKAFILSIVAFILCIL